MFIKSNTSTTVKITTLPTTAAQRSICCVQQQQLSMYRNFGNRRRKLSNTCNTTEYRIRDL